MKIAGKHDEAKDEVCPLCRDKFRDFLKPLSGNLLGCYKCGVVFIKRSVLVEEREVKKEKLERREEEHE